MAYEHSGSVQMGSRNWLIMNWLHRVKAIFGIQYRKYFGFANVGKIPMQCRHLVFWSFNSFV